jgi:triacylglycerol lipase
MAVVFIEPSTKKSISSSGPVEMCKRILFMMAGLQLFEPEMVAREHVVLLHGLCRTKSSMVPLEKALDRAGYRVWNSGYASRSASIKALGEQVIPASISQCRSEGAATIHFVTHSMGGMLVRSYLKTHSVPELGRVVMLAPPNQGSELVDRLGHFWIFQKVNGPAGSEMGSRENSVPMKLGPLTFHVGVIAGNRSVNWINSLLIPGADDGKVSVEKTRAKGMADHIVVPSSHPFIMRNKQVIRQTLVFLQTGKFENKIQN